MKREIVVNEWLKRDKAAATQWIVQSALSQETKDQILVIPQQ